MNDHLKRLSVSETLIVCTFKSNLELMFVKPTIDQHFSNVDLWIKFSSFFSYFDLIDFFVFGVIVPCYYCITGIIHSIYFVINKIDCFSVCSGVMRTKRRNTYVVNQPVNIDTSSNACVSNSSAQSNTANDYLSSTSPVSSSMSERPTNGSLKSVHSLDDDNHGSLELPHQMQHSRNSIDLASTTDSSTTDLVTRTWNVNICRHKKQSITYSASLRVLLCNALCYL